MGGLLGSLGLVTAIFDADTQRFDAKVAKSAIGTDASARAIANAVKRQADAVAFASKFSGDAVSASSIRIINTMKAEAAAAADYRKMQYYSRTGLLDEKQAAIATAAAYDRLTAAQKAAKAAAPSGGSSLFGDLGNSIRSLAGGAVIAETVNKLREAVTSSLAFGQEIERMSQKTGLAVGTLSTLHYAAAITGSDFELLSKAVAKMDKSIGQATEGDKKQQAYLRALGLDAKDLASRSDGAEVAFRRFAETIAATENPIRRVELATGLLGRAGAEQIPMLIQVGNNWDYFKQKAEQAGVQLDGQTAESLMKTNRTLADLKQKLFGAGLGFTEGLNPGLQEFFRLMSSGQGSMNAFEAFGAIAGRGIAVAAGMMFTLAAGMAQVFELVDKARGDKAGLAIDSSIEKDDWSKVDDANYFALNGRPRYLRESRAEHNAMTGNGSDGGDGGFQGAGDPAGDQKRLKADEAQVAMIKLQGDYTAKAEFDYWARRIAAYAKGSNEYNTILEKQAALAMEGAKHAHELIKTGMKAYSETANLSPAEATKGIDEFNQLLREQAEDVTRTGTRWEAYNAALEKNTGIAAKNAAAMRELQILHGTQTGAITKASGDAEMSSARQAAYRQEIADLRSQLERVKADTANLDPSGKDYEKQLPELAARQATLQGQIVQIEGQAALDAQKAQWDAFTQTAVGGAVAALQKFAIEATDASAVLGKLTGEILGDVNSGILKELTSKNRSDRRYVWRDTGKAIFTSTADSALKAGEGTLMKAFGLSSGKLGTRGNPMFVKNVDALGSLSSSAGTDAARNFDSLFNSSPSSNPGVQSSILKSGFGALMSAIPGFASGVDNFGGGMAWVGEQGPELLNLPRGSSVTPTGKMPSFGGHTIHFAEGAIDARGSSDPAMVAHMVQQGIAAAAPHLIAASVHAHNENNLRMPSSRRS